jgi:hypothetical protein
MYLVVTADDDGLVAATERNGLLQHWYGGDVKALDKHGKQLVIAYWRKANAIHGWFVRTQAGGIDNCEPVPVSREALENLLDRAKQVLSRGGTEQAAREFDLETQGGFFFGSTGYNEWYLQSLTETVVQLEAVLRAEWPMPVSFAYEASW